MDNFNDTFVNYNNNVKGWFSSMGNKEYIITALGLILIVYASYAVPKLPLNILKLFDNPLFKLLVFFLIVWLAQVNPTIAIIAAVALMVTIHTLNKAQLNEKINILAFKHKEGMNNLFDNCNKSKLLSFGDQYQHQYTMEDIVKSDEFLQEDSVLELQEEKKEEPIHIPINNDGCVQHDNFRNNFYPQYINMKQNTYLGNDVNGFDPNAGYASI